MDWQVPLRYRKESYPSACVPKGSACCVWVHAKKAQCCRHGIFVDELHKSPSRKSLRAVINVLFRPHKDDEGPQLDNYLRRRLDLHADKTTHQHAKWNSHREGSGHSVGESSSSDGEGVLEAFCLRVRIL